MKLELSRLSKRFSSRRGAVDALDEVELTVESGEFFVLLGPSGCGKSTLLNLLAGLETPSGGEIRFDGRVVAVDGGASLPPRERRVAMVFQSYALYPHLSVYGNIAFPLRIGGEKGEGMDRKVRQAAATLQIEELLDARPRELSGGQRQRVAIARAIVREPDLFLLDEPLSNLDAQLRATTRVELKRLQRRLGVTTVYVTHDQGEAMTLGDRIAVMRRGRIEQVGTAGELYAEPVNPFVARFVGSPPMNLLRAGLTREEGRCVVELGGRRLELPEPHREALDRLAGDRCLFGIRPEHIRIGGGEGGPRLLGTVDTVEAMGRENLLHVAIEGGRLSALSDRGGFARGDRVDLAPDLSRAHIFPPEE